MEIGLGHLHFPPATFWAMTLTEYLAAQRGWLESIGADVSACMTRDRLSELKRMYPDTASETPPV